MSPQASSRLPDEVALDRRDGRYLRQAIGWSQVARDRATGLSAR